ncbi:hypothetical protein CEW89_19715 [Celeribacter ethanolicus]|uniref:Uncharacterized protein n=1 Tax=Celeribacter ethanolicus TaxID=1758178 RepID=A0A291GGV7_9RHOB|nr:hypothetical protein CEW89_19715 [Celeribacter ethanolicus]
MQHSATGDFGGVWQQGVKIGLRTEIKCEGHTGKAAPEMARRHCGSCDRFEKEIGGGEVVGDPGIEPGMSLLGGVTVRCRTLQPVAHFHARSAITHRPFRVVWAVDTSVTGGRQQENCLFLEIACAKKGQP